MNKLNMISETKADDGESYLQLRNGFYAAMQFETSKIIETNKLDSSSGNVQ